MRERAAATILQVMQSRFSERLRLGSALALAEFADVQDVPPALAEGALDREAPLDFRYSAFTSLSARRSRGSGPLSWA